MRTCVLEFFGAEGFLHNAPEGGCQPERRTLGRQWRRVKAFCLRLCRTQRPWNATEACVSKPRSTKQNSRASRPVSESRPIRGILGALQAELPKLEASALNPADIEDAQGAAWDSVARDFQAQVPNEINELVNRSSAATLRNHPDASFSVALVAICPTIPARQR